MSPDEPLAATAEPVALAYAPVNKVSSRWGKGFLAVAASLLLPGLGHLIAGRHRRARFWFGVYLVTGGGSLICLAHPATLLAGIGVGALGTFLGLAMLVDSFIIGRQSDRRLLGSPWLRYVAGIGCLVAAQLAQPNILLALYLRDHYVEAFRGSSGAMRPALLPGDRFLAHKHTDIHRYSIVVFEHPQFGPGVRISSRIVGLPGETVEIIDGRIQVNGQSIAMPTGLSDYVSMSYIGRQDRSLLGRPGAGCKGNPIHLGPDEYYVLGDNSTSSMDSRLWETVAKGYQLGGLPRDCIVGRVTAIYWPPQRWQLFR